MGTLQDTLDRETEKLPRTAAMGLVRGKLAELGIDSEDLVERVADAILASDGSGARLEIEWPESIDISFDEGDAERLLAAIDRVVEGLPDTVERLAHKVSVDIASSAREQWATTRSASDEATKTRASILEDWGKAIDELRMLIDLCIQEGDDFNVRQMQSKEKAARDQARARLHIRACRIAEEIVVLIEHGLAEGAMARWRTLHEVAVVATLIKQGGDDLAQRYFDHNAVERKRMLDDFHRAAEAAGIYTPVNTETKEIERAFDRVTAKHGKHFQAMYGWASEQLGMPKDPKFHDLQAVAGSLSLKHRFRIASSGNHASVATLGQPVHLWDPTTTVPGAFAAGFERPAADTAQAIVQATTALYDEPWDLDQLVLAGALTMLRDETATTWFETARRVEARAQRSMDRAVRIGRERRIGHVKSRPVGGWR